MTHKQVLNRALAEAFLAGEWSARALRERGERVLAARAPWLPPLARRVVARFPSAPSRGELVALLAEDDALALAYAAGPLRPRVRAYVLAEPAMPEPRYAVPVLATTGALAAWLGVSVEDLAWLSGVFGREQRPTRHYDYRAVAKPGGATRLLESPKARLKSAQRRVLHGILDAVPPHAAAHGFRRGHSVRDFAAPHAGRAFVLRLDLRDFFTSVRAARARAVFRALGYPEDVARALAALCTHAPPRGAALPPGVALTPALRAPHLPQGAPTSPALANLVAYRLDARLDALAGASGARYTRYADDLAFSGDRAFARGWRRFFARACEVAAAEGFAVHPRKTRAMPACARQHLAGVVVNVAPAAPRAEYDALKAVLHNCARTGPAAQNRDGHPDLRAHLAGRVAWVASLSPARGAKLRAALARIDWGGAS